MHVHNLFSQGMWESLFVCSFSDFWQIVSLGSRCQDREVDIQEICWAYCLWMIRGREEEQSEKAFRPWSRADNCERYEKKEKESQNVGQLWESLVQLKGSSDTKMTQRGIQYWRTLWHHRVLSLAGAWLGNGWPSLKAEADCEDTYRWRPTAIFCLSISL